MTDTFLASFPAYEATSKLDELRATDYARLDRTGTIYLDYTGSGVAAQSQFDFHVQRLGGQCFGNPHSEHPSSVAATELVEETRAEVLDYFHADPADYVAIFTANASAACKLVGEAYPFDSNCRLVLTADNHNSVNGIREFARARGADVVYLALETDELRIPDTTVRRAVSTGRGLLAFPAQSNFTGVQHPLEWIDLAHEHGYDVLLDAAAYVPTNRLDLSVVAADFVPISWYKVFGYPTGVGCLIARREALARLRRPWFAGGTIQAVSVAGDWFQFSDAGAAFEDGTPNFLNIPDVGFGLRWISDIGMELISERVRCLTRWLLSRLTQASHSNGMPLVRVYGPTDGHHRGATIALNILDATGAVVDERLVGAEAADRRMSVRAGCFCNPGAAEAAFGIDIQRLVGVTSHQPRTIDDYLELLGLPSGGAIRVSFGIASTHRDAEAFADFVIDTYRDRVIDALNTVNLAARLHC